MSSVDPYFDDNIGDLRNLLGAKTSEETWSLVVDDENDEASRLAAELMDLSKLEVMFAKIIT